MLTRHRSDWRVAKLIGPMGFLVQYLLALQLKNHLENALNALQRLLTSIASTLASMNAIYSKLTNIQSELISSKKRDRCEFVVGSRYINSCWTDVVPHVC